MNKFKPYIWVLLVNLLFSVVYGLMNWYGLEVLKMEYWKIWCWIQIVTSIQAVGTYMYGNYRDKKLESGVAASKARFTVTS